MSAIKETPDRVGTTFFRVKHGLDDFLEFFLDHLSNHFFRPFCRGGKHTIGTKGGVGCSISVLREGWEAVLLLREG